MKRLKEHEASIRLGNNRTALGPHYIKHQLEQDPVPIYTEKPDIENLLAADKLKIIDKGRDSIEGYIKEGLHIRQLKPILNEKLENGWVR